MNHLRVVERDTRTPSFRRAGSKLPWTTQCDGMPTLMGCSSEIETPRPYRRVGEKSSGWLITYGWDDERKVDDPSIMLAFCPGCAPVVKEQEAKQGHEMKGKADG